MNHIDVLKNKIIFSQFEAEKLSIAVVTVHFCNKEMAVKELFFMRHFIV